MSDTTPSAASAMFGAFDPLRQPAFPCPADAAASTPVPASAPPPGSRTGSSGPAPVPPPRLPGRVRLNKTTLRMLREAKCLSQEELVNDFERRNIRVSIATIKRAETGHYLRFRIVRELARYFEVTPESLLPN